MVSDVSQAAPGGLVPASAGYVGPWAWGTGTPVHMGSVGAYGWPGGFPPFAGPQGTAGWAMGLPEQARGNTATIQHPNHFVNPDAESE